MQTALLRIQKGISICQCRPAYTLVKSRLGHIELSLEDEAHCHNAAIDRLQEHVENMFFSLRTSA